MKQNERGENKLSTKEKLLNELDESGTKNISEVCRTVGITNSTFYFHFYKDAAFRRSVLEKQREYLTEQIEAIGA